jgi:hypothetical protein
MLDNTFDEEYFRLENVIDTNHTSFSVDREGKLLLTHPYFKSGQITEVLPRDTGVNILPDNVNLIIDNIDLFSTNPFCQNYLPLRIPFGAGKPNVEFGDINFSQLDNFKVIVDPLLPVDTFRSHRYSNSQDYVTRTAPNDTLIHYSYVLNCGTFSINYPDKVPSTLYALNGNYKIEMVQRGYSPTPDIVLIRTDLDTRDIKEYIISDFNNATRFINIYPNDNLCLVVCEGHTGDMLIYDITLEPASSTPFFYEQWTYPNWRLVKFINITQDNEFVVVHSLPDGPNYKTTVDVIIKFYVPSLNPLWTLGSAVSVDSYPFLDYYLFSVGVFFTNRLTYVIRDVIKNKYILRDVQLTTTIQSIANKYVVLLEKDITSIINETLPIAPTGNGFLDVNSYLYLGGDSISTPNISIFYWDNSSILNNRNKLYFVNFNPYNNISPIIFNKYRYEASIHVYDILSLSSLIFFNIKRYFNQVYIYTLEPEPPFTVEDWYIYAWNLDINYERDNKFRYSLENLSLITKLTTRVVDCVNFSKNYFILAGRVSILQIPTYGNDYANSILTTVYKNQRYGNNGSTLATVYKMSYNFVERTYPYTIQGNNITFRIDLPNRNPVEDIEIFKYAIDIRVRFTKNKAKINESEPAQEGTNVGLDFGNLLQCEEDCVLDSKERQDCKLECEQPKQQPQEQECKTDANGKVVCSTKPPVNRDPKCIEKCGKEKCMTKCNRAVGGVGRVLGYVGDDFSVIDFLNLYTRN